MFQWRDINKKCPIIRQKSKSQMGKDHLMEKVNHCKMKAGKRNTTKRNTVLTPEDVTKGDCMICLLQRYLFEHGESQL
jgi:hypothetical protein